MKDFQVYFLKIILEPCDVSEQVTRLYEFFVTLECEQAQAGMELRVIQVKTIFTH